MVDTVYTTWVDGFPSIMGLTYTHGLSGAPRVELEESSPGSGQPTVRFKQTQSTPPALSSVSIAPRDDDLGLLDVRMVGSDVFIKKDLPAVLVNTRIRPAPGSNIAEGSYQLRLRITDEAAKRINTLEHQHVEDFELAYELSAVAFAQTVNALTGRTFAGETVDAARKAALEALRDAAGPVFVPSYPLDLDSWTTRIRQVYAAVSDGTGIRDGRGGKERASDYEHRGWWQATPNFGVKPWELYIEPYAPDPRQESAALIRIESVPLANPAPDWTAAADPLRAPIPLNQRVRLVEQYQYEDVTVPAGAFGRYDGNPADGTGFMFKFEWPGEGDFTPTPFPKDIFSKLEPISPPAVPFADRQHVKLTADYHYRYGSEDTVLKKDMVGQITRITLMPTYPVGLAFDVADDIVSGLFPSEVLDVLEPGDPPARAAAVSPATQQSSESQVDADDVSGVTENPSNQSGALQPQTTPSNDLEDQFYDAMRSLAETSASFDEWAKSLSSGNPEKKGDQ